MGKPIVTEVRVNAVEEVVATFNDTTEILFMPRTNTVGVIHGLNKVVVTYRGKEVARYMGEHYRFSDTAEEHAFEYITSPATPQLVSKYCRAAREHAYREAENGVSNQVLSAYLQEFILMGML